MPGLPDCTVYPEKSALDVMKWISPHRVYPGTGSSDGKQRKGRSVAHLSTLPAAPLPLHCSSSTPCSHKPTPPPPSPHSNSTWLTFHPELPPCVFGDQSGGRRHGLRRDVRHRHVRLACQRATDGHGGCQHGPDRGGSACGGSSSSRDASGLVKGRQHPGDGRS